MARINNERIYRLWDELSDFGVAAVDEALMHCLGQLCRWLNADNAFWIGAVRIMDGNRARTDPILGWRATTVEWLNAPAMDQSLQRQRINRMNKDDPGQATRSLVETAGQFRVHRLRAGDLVDFEDFRRTDHYDFFYRSLGIADRIWVVFPVSREAECYYCIDKQGPRRRFSAADAELAGTVMRGIKWFHRQLLLSHGLGLAETPLTPAEKRALRLLVTGDCEKTIAKRLGVTAGTTHQYVLSIYRKFGVRSRPELLSLWLNHRV